MSTVAPPNDLASLLADVDAAASALDADRVAAFLLDSPGFAWTFNGRTLTSVAEVRDAHAQAWRDVASASFTTGEPRVALIGADRAVLTATGRSERTFRDGRRMSRDYAITLYVVRSAAGWRIVQAHESTPQ